MECARAALAAGRVEGVGRVVAVGEGDRQDRIGTSGFWRADARADTGSEGARSRRAHAVTVDLTANPLQPARLGIKITAPSFCNGYVKIRAGCVGGAGRCELGDGQLCPRSEDMPACDAQCRGAQTP